MSAMPFVLHVAPDGCDGWAGTAEQPLATLAGARDRLRLVRRAGKLTGPSLVLVHAGLYPLRETFTLGPEDLGTADTPVTFQAAGDGEVRLLGGTILSGFQPHQGPVMKLDLAAQGLAGLRCKQLFYNGVRQILARYPNYDPANPYAGGYLYVEGEVHEEHTPGLGYRDRFICHDPRLATWSRISEVELFVFPRWNYGNSIVRLKSYDPQTGEVRLAGLAHYEIYPGDRFYFRNVREELDAPGEWYLDAAGETLYFWPPDTLEGAVVSVPMVQELVRIQGDPQEATELLFGRAEPRGFITLRGFTLEGCDGHGVVIRDASHCAVLGCVVRNTGQVGVYIHGGMYNRVEGCDIYQTGSAGVRCGGGLRSTFGGYYLPCHNSVRNCYVHHIGVFDKWASGIYLVNDNGPSVGVTASHNLVHDGPRQGITSNGNDNVVEYNHVRHMNLETGDSAGIGLGTRDWTVRGQIVRYNIIHDILGYHRVQGEWRSPAYCFGIYLDDWTSDVRVYGNLTYRVPRAGVYIHAGQDNIVENNILVDSPNELAYFSRWDEEKELRHVGTHDVGLRRNIFRRNILASRVPGSYAYRFASALDAEGRLDVARNTWERNLLWFGGRPVEHGCPRLARNVPGEMPKMPWEEWRALGFDEGSLIADPGFVDPDHDDYRLRPDSPAFALGFEPLPLEEVGPYASEFRASWPIVEAEGAREHPLLPIRVDQTRRNDDPNW